MMVPLKIVEVCIVTYIFRNKNFCSGFDEFKFFFKYVLRDNNAYLEREKTKKING